MTHFAYPNTNTRQKQTIFTGCGRFIAATEPPGEDYHEAAPKMTRTLEILFDAAAFFAPESLENHTRMYERKDLPHGVYQGDSMGLAYFLAFINRACPLALTDWQGDIWCTGDIVRQDGDGFHLRPVAYESFQKKLDAFLAPENPDRLFILPFANIGTLYGECAEHANLVRVTKEHPLVWDEAQDRKTVLLVNSDALPQLLHLLFVMPDTQPATRTRLNRPRTYIPCPTFNYFVGRQAELRAVIEDIHSETNYTILVNAMGGIGKTVLASHVVETIKEEFTGVYYTKCTPDTDADELLSELAYFLAEHGDPSLAEVFEYAAQQEPKLNALMTALNANCYLLLFDDLHDILDRNTSEILRPDVSLFFEHLLTRAHRSKVFLISRTHPAMSFGLVNRAEHQLDGLDREAGLTFLRDLQVSEDPGLLQQAYNFTHGHPVSMQLLAELKRTMPLQEIFADIKEFFEIPQVASRLLQRIYHTMTPDEQSVMLQNSVLPRPVAYSVIRALCELPKIGQIVSNLVRKTLVIYDEHQQHYRLHDVIRDFHRSQLSDEQRTTLHLKAATYYEQQKFNPDQPTFQQVQDRLEARYHYFQAGEIEKSANLLLDVAEYYRTWGYLESCRTLLEETLKALETLEPIRERQLLKVDLLVELSWVEERSEGIEKAFIRCKQSEAVLRITDDKIRLGKLYHAMGRFYFQKTSFKEAETFLNLSFEIKKQQENTNGLIKILEPLRELYMPMNLANITKIKQRCEEAINICEKKKKSNDKARILWILARALESQSKLQEALTTFQKSLVSCDDNNWSGKCYSLQHIGQILRKNESYEHAVKKYEESLSFALKARDLISQGRSLQGIGDTYRDNGRIEIAVKKYEEAVEIIRNSTNLQGKASLFHDIALSYRDSGQFSPALKLLELSSQLKEDLNNLAGLAVDLSHIGRIYAEYLSNLDTALEYQKQSLEIRKKLRRGIYIEVTEEDIGHIYKMRGELQKALKIFENLLKQKRIRGDYGRMRVLDHIGSIFCIKKEFQKALEYHKESLRLCEEAGRLSRKAITLNHIGEIHIGRSNYHEALTTLKESFELQKVQYKKTEPLTNIADVYFRQGKLAEAMATCEESLALSRTYGGRIQAGVTLHLMAKILMQDGKPEEALPHIQEAVSIFEDTGSRHLPEAEETLKHIQEQQETHI